MRCIIALRAQMTFVDLSGDIEAATGGFDLYMAFSAGAGQFQRLLQVVTINYQFPQSWVDLANYLRAFIDFDLPSLAEPECQIKMSAMGRMLLRTRMMALMIPAIVFMVAIGIAIKMRKSKDVSVRGALFIIFEVAVALHSMFFIAVTKAALAPFDCTDIGNTGTSRLDRNNAAICDELDGEYQSLRTWGFGMLLIFGRKKATDASLFLCATGLPTDLESVVVSQSSSLCFTFRTGALLAAFRFSVPAKLV